MSIYSLNKATTMSDRRRAYADLTEGLSAEEIASITGCRPITAGGVTYERDESLALRDKLISERDACLGPDKFDPNMAVVLSHTIAWMAVAIETLLPLGEG